MRVLAWDVGVKTLSYCVLDVVVVDAVQPAVRVRAWETINVHTEANLSDKAKPTMREDAEYVIDALTRRRSALWDADVDAVVIEQQPAGGSNRFCSVRMKSMSHVIHGYFYGMQQGDGMGVDAAVIPVTFVSPSSKLVGMDTGETAADVKSRQDGDRTAMGAKYRKNKRHAVDTTDALLASMGADADAARATFAAAAPKQDDLSDCFMLAYAFATKATAAAKPKRKRAAPKAKAEPNPKAKRKCKPCETLPPPPLES